MNKFTNKNYLIFSLLFIVLSFFIMKTFLFGIIWGIVTAISAWPIFEHLSKKEYSFLNRKISDNALIFSFVFSLVFIIPIFYALFELANLYSIVIEYINHNTNNGVISPPVFLDYLPYKEHLLNLWDKNVAHSTSLIEYLNKFSSGELFNLFSGISSEIMDRLITIIVMIVSFYLILKNGELIKSQYKNIFTYWIGEEAADHIDDGIDSLRGTINGVILIGICEGILLSIPLVWGHFPSGFVLALIAGVLGVIPMLMPIIIAPCLLYIYATGEQAIAIFGFIDLAIVWFLFENIIKPKVISEKVKINTFIILLSMIGGMQFFGPLGLFLGPAVISMTIGMMTDIFVIPTDKNK